jgi:hypothetical protein
MLPFPSRSANSKLQKELKHDDESHRHINYTIKRCRINENASSSTQDESEIHTALETGGLIDLEIDRELRKRRRKKFSKRPDRLRLTDPVTLVDLDVVSNYDAFFSSSIDPKLSLNTKGPLANLWFGFKVIILIYLSFLILFDLLFDCLTD